ncbi:hypothetical protein [Streptomyces sp. NBC_00094]|uniref:hypothetical protein n=1 Tax=Streptomyces sp. NBC_00094 TaxID=2903620 RepID=UPI002251AC8B|nr:hypothetical protein [Streptomyces sp. NBC_00094]MCX5395220.1 hypothetical protein [Streptomyces sp. NBC_00094]
MSQGKLRGRLRLALMSPADASDDRLLVYIELADVPSPEQVALLRQVGATGTIEGHKIITASMSKGEIEPLSREPWVISISLSEMLRMLSSEPASHSAT